MLIIPAIDLLEGKAVRLSKGLREEATIYSDNPIELIEGFVAQGASRVHIVDLDGAFAGSRQHSEIVASLCERSTVPVQVGGGIRDAGALAQCFTEGASFAVLGTAAIKSPEFVQAACEQEPGKVIVAVDAKKGMVAVEGWVETSTFTATELGQKAASWGAAALLYTDVDRDGMHSGPNLPATRALAEACSIPVIASGGISTLDDIRRLKDAGIEMAVVGRALYDKHFTLAEAIEAAR
jgi:phosphoribosylformimino-5-aminoimidazole carboxamide ribotide isomerase